MTAVSRTCLRAIACCDTSGVARVPMCKWAADPNCVCAPPFFQGRRHCQSRELQFNLRMQRQGSIGRVAANLEHDRRFQRLCEFASRFDDLATQEKALVRGLLHRQIGQAVARCILPPGSQWRRINDWIHDAIGQSPRNVAPCWRPAVKFPRWRVNRAALKDGATCVFCC